MNDDDLAPILRDLLADEDLWAEPDPGGADALLAAIRAEGRVDPGPVAEQPPPTTEPPDAAGTFVPPPASPGDVTPGAVPRPEPSGAPAATPVVPLAPRRRRGLRMLAAAAALVAVVGAVGLVLATRGGDEGGEAREAAIGGTELQPDASAVARVEEVGSGVAIELDVSDLPAAPPEHYYEAWLKGPDGLVPIGTFHMREGDEVVELWAGVDLDDYPTLTVTIQQEQTGQESSGQVVLTGEIG